RVTSMPGTVVSEYDKPALLCPAASGSANYAAGPYSPLTRPMYFPAQNTCSTVSAVRPGGPGVYGFARRSTIAPQSGTDLGQIHAIDAVTGRSSWSYAQPPGLQSRLTTGGGLR